MSAPRVTFVPHLTPMVRGILATVYARITKDTDFQALYEKRFTVAEGVAACSQSA